MTSEDCGTPHVASFVVSLPMSTDAAAADAADDDDDDDDEARCVTDGELCSSGLHHQRPVSRHLLA